jgi:prepilin-type processing-associated H-X9-DG protein
LFDYYAKATNLVVCPAATKPPVAEAQAAVTAGQGAVDTPWQKTLDNNTPYTAAYGFNGWFFTDKTNGIYEGDGSAFVLPNNIAGNQGYFGSASNVQRPSDTAIFFDENWTDCWPMENDAPCSDTYQGRLLSYQNNEMGRIAIVRHGSGKAGSGFEGTMNQLPGSINVGFFDGHSQLTKLPALWTTCVFHAQWSPTSVQNKTAIAPNQ